jgi:hypothetical protein
MSLAAIKRKLQAGQKIEMVAHSWFPVAGSKVAGVREVKRVQSNAVQFTPTAPGSNGSWLYFDAGAKNYRLTDKGFEVDLRDDGTFAESMTYEWR